MSNNETHPFRIMTIVVMIAVPLAFLAKSCNERLDLRTCVEQGYDYIKGDCLKSHIEEK